MAQNYIKLTPEFVKDKVVIIRSDLNVPQKNRKITDPTRIKKSIETYKFCKENGAKQVHILSHFGRPKAAPESEYSLDIVAEKVQDILGETIEFRTYEDDFTAGDSFFQLHENVRFYAGEKKNDPELIQKMIKNTGAEVFVNDAFGSSHRAHASVIGIATYLPCSAGKLLEKEIEALSPFIGKNEKIPGLGTMISGAKVDTKMKIIQSCAVTAENVFIGGALANTFLAAKGYEVGTSLYQADFAPMAQEVFEIAKTNNTNIHLPIDIVCGTSPDSEAHVFDADKCPEDMAIFDVGPKTIENFKNVLKDTKSFIFNGPVGLFEAANFGTGTKEFLRAAASQKSIKTFLGGADTISAMHKFGMDDSAFTHVSTGGGAMLEFLEGEKLPGIEILRTGEGAL